MAKQELSDAMYSSLKTIMQELAGYTIEEAEAILRVVAIRIKKCAIIEEDNSDG